MAATFTAMLNFAMRLKDERDAAAHADKRTHERSGFALGDKPRKLDNPAGTLAVQVAKNRGAKNPFCLQALDRRRLNGAPARGCNSR